jgi:hypothetical protein
MMDRSYLSDPAVVTASREFVCIRLATYESASEAKVLASVFQSRSGLLENTVFALLAPDGKTLLARSGRSPREAVGGTPDEAVKALAAKLKELSGKYPGSAPVGAALPTLADLRRGLNVAACEIQPLVGIVAGGDESRKKIEQALLPLIWSGEFAGRFAVARAKDLAEAAEYVDGALKGDGVFVVQPDAFGLKGRLLAFVPGSDRDAMAAALKQGLQQFVAESKDSRRHIDEGMRRGIRWKTEIPVTDPMAPKR